MNNNDLANEWTLLQQQSAAYEKHGLLIKLVAVVLVAAGLFLRPGLELAMCALVMVLWLQDAIWKTFQSRLDERIVLLESLLAAPSGDQNQGAAYQLHTRFQAQRLQGGVIKQYLAQAIRPTVAYPYVVLIGFLAALLVLPV